MMKVVGPAKQMTAAARPTALCDISSLFTVVQGEVNSPVCKAYLIA
jgi:hypothetical protein